MTKEELIDKYRDMNVDRPDWYEWVYQCFEEDMEKEHIEVFDITFEGFYHQGSHASYEGVIKPRSMAKFMEKHKLNISYPAEYALACKEGLWAARNMRYGGVEIECDDWEYVEICEDKDMNSYYIEQYKEELENTIDSFETELTSILDDHARKLYVMLRDEYEYLTSEEAVWDAIVANELDKQLDEIQTDVCNT